MQSCTRVVFGTSLRYNIYEMSMQSKKLTILYVLKILKDGSNKDHPISQAMVTRTINLMGIKCDRKTIARDVDCLNKKCV